MKTKILLSSIFLAMVLAAGCGMPKMSPPVTVAQYEKMQKESPGSYPEPTILMVNRQRFMDKDLTPAERIASMTLLDRLGANDPEVRQEFAAVLSDAATNEDVRKATLDLLLKKDDPALAGPLAQGLTRLKPGSPMYVQVSEWLAKHRSPAGISEIVRLWAAQNPQGPADAAFMDTIQKISGAPWDQALLDGLNSAEVESHGAAIDILVRHMPAQELGKRIAKMEAKSDAVRAIQSFQSVFDYMPATEQEFLTVCQLYGGRAGTLGEAARMFNAWHKDGYVFNIRDFHLLDRLAADPLRPTMRKEQLVLELQHCLGSREHIRWKPADKAGANVDDSLAANLPRLTVADLWNIYLLQEMFNRPRTQAALRVVAEQDRDDRTTAWGGLVFYRSGQAEAVLYKAAQGSESDQEYVPGSRMIVEGRDAMCHFCTRFEVVENSSRVGPTPDDLHDAAKNNWYGLIVTSVNKDTFCAHYYNPEGAVVSLGAYPFQVWKQSE
jgi:hypothetical protein